MIHDNYHNYNVFGGVIQLATTSSHGTWGYEL